MTPPIDQELDDKLAGLSDEHYFQSTMDWLVEHADRARPEVRKVVEARGGPVSYPRAVLVLGRMSHEDDVPLLIEHLMSSDEDDSYHPARALGEHRADAAFEALVAATASDQHHIARNAAIALGYRGDERARTVLEELLDHPATEVRFGAVKGLSRLGAEPSRARLKARRKVEKDRDVKAEIDKALK